MAPSSLYFSLVRNILRHRTPYNQSLAPFFRDCHPFTVKWVLNEQPHLAQVVIAARSLLEQQQSVGACTISSVEGAPHSPSFVLPNDPLELRELIRLVTTTMAREATVIGLEASRWLDMMRERVDATPAAPEPGSQQPLAQVGDIVVRHDLPSQRGVVGAIIPYCFQSTEWVVEYLKSVDDKRVSQPWYLVLVEHSEFVSLDFTRYGSSLTHTNESVFRQNMAKASVEVSAAQQDLLLPPMNGPSKAIGLHRYLPLFFKGFDVEKGSYIPHEDRELSMSGVKWLLPYAPGKRTRSFVEESQALPHHALISDQD